jgi:hypothetical protein
MLRKTILAITAAAALGGAALAPTSASALTLKIKHWGHYHHGWYGPGFGFYGYAPGYWGGCYFVKRWVPTPFGVKLRRVRVCG